MQHSLRIAPASRANQKIELGSIVEAGQVFTLLQTEHLSLGEMPQVGKDCRSLLPVVAHPR